MLLLWLDWLIQGVLGLLVRCQGERLDWVPECVHVLVVEEKGCFGK